MLVKRNQLIFTSKFFFVVVVFCDLIQFNQIFRLVSTNTVEERIKALQEHKLEMASAVLTGKERSGGGLSMDDLRNLFNM